MKGGRVFMTRDRPKRPVCRKVKFTDRKVQELVSKPPKKGESAIEWTCLAEDNLKLCVYPSGKASWRQRGMLNGKKVFITIAPVNVMNLVKVREIVRANKELLLRGIHPKDAVRLEESPALETFVEDDFMPYARKKYKSIKDVESRLKGKILPQFGRYRLADIRKADIVRYHEQVQEAVSSITANRTLSLLSSVLKRAVDLELIDRNPARGIKKFYEGESRDRFLSDLELKRFFCALRKRLDTPQGKALFLLIATGARRSEILGCQWKDVDLESRQIYIPDPKNRKPRFLAVNSQAYELLCEMEKDRSSSPFLFPSNSSKGHLLEVRRTFARIIKEAGIDNFRGHDLRRTNASLLINGGARLEDVRVALGHESVKSTIIYARLSADSMAKTSEIAAKKIGEAMGVV
jgi:integrase